MRPEGRSYMRPESGNHLHIRRRLLAHAIADHLAHDPNVVGSFNEFERRDGVQAPRECLIATGALRARSQMSLGNHDVWPVFAVVMQNELIVAEMAHLPLQ